MGIFEGLSRFFLRYFSPYSSHFYQGLEYLPGLQKEVQCDFQTSGIPRIRAENEEDLFYIQGYLHAKERFWQMESMRCFFRGELAGLFGILPLKPPEISHHLSGFTTLDLDRFVRTFGIWQAAQKGKALLSETFLPPIQAYIHGINTYLEQLEESPHLAPLELRFLQRTPDPWTIEDCCAVEKMMTFQLNYTWKSVLALFLVESKIGYRASYLQYHPPETPTEATHTLGEKLVENLLFLEEQTRQFMGIEGSPQGSNSWAISGKHSKTGKPLLANDPHLSLLLPATWYAVEMEAPTFFVSGVGIPGCPGVVVGRNRTLAWGITNAMADDSDLYFEEIHENGKYYRQDSSWKSLEIREEKIPVRKQESQFFKVRSTERGPLLSDALTTLPPSSLGISFQWPMHQASAQVENFYWMAKSQTKEDLLNAVQTFVGPAQNLVYADREGNIGFQGIGKIPIRATKTRGLKIQHGASALAWKGFIPFAELPALQNPPSGFIVMANHRVVDEQYPYYFSHFFEPSYRAQQIWKRLQEKELWDLESMESLFLDVHCLHAKRFVSRHLKAIEAMLRTPLEKQAFECLNQWDFQFTQDSPATSLFNVWYIETLKLVLEPKLGSQVYRCYVEILHQATTPFEEILEGKTPLLSEKEVPYRLYEAWTKALAFLEKNYGSAWEGWSWGKLHQIALQHPFGKIPGFGASLNLGPVPYEGGSMTVNNGSYSLALPFRQLLGASCRMVASLATEKELGVILPGGQSGHFNSPYYGDQLALWREGKLAYPDHRPFQGKKRFCPAVEEPEFYLSGEPQERIPKNFGESAELLKGSSV
jgi:penicillin amidase